MAKSAEEGGEEDDRQGDEPLAESGKGSPQAWRTMMGRRKLYERKKKPFPCQEDFCISAHFWQAFNPSGPARTCP